MRAGGQVGSMQANETDGHGN